MSEIIKMTDIFDTKISCKKCGKEMEKVKVNMKGFGIRAVRCRGCKEEIVHPSDIHALEQFKDLKGKNFHVKMRVVGNSHAISIPKEIVNFINEMHRDMQSEMDMVRLQFDDFNRLSVHFDEHNDWGDRDR
tara:strand:- start:2593 stop:2985 length:393 start_codon:yes stop_codon:yes gene_type:complete